MKNEVSIPPLNNFSNFFLLPVHAETRRRGEIEIVNNTMDPFFKGCSTIMPSYSKQVGFCRSTINLAGDIIQSHHGFSARSATPREARFRSFSRYRSSPLFFQLLSDCRETVTNMS
jgi:hypothetical protein